MLGLNRIALLAGLLVPVLAHAAPTTKPVKDSTPTEAYTSFINAIERQDPDAALALCDGGTDPNAVEVAKREIASDIAVVDFRKTVAKKYGMDGANAVTGAFGQQPKPSTAGEVRPNGDDGVHAELLNKQGNVLRPMIQHDGHWRIDFVQVQARIGVKRERVLALWDTRKGTAEKLKPDVESGHFTSLDKIMEAAFQGLSGR